MNHAARIFLGASVSEKGLDGARKSTLVNVGDPKRAYSSFWWRLVLSAVIATGGIAVSSPAVVIGAMLIAPLMSPMLGTTLAVALGDARAALRTFVITVAGAAACIVAAIAVSAIIPVDIDTGSNTEILARVSPRLADLIIALASGLMASIAVLRDDIPDALPGVAIAAAIVPPLCVVGCALYAGDLSSAAGATVLFLANYLAIQMSGFLFFLAVGVRRKRTDLSDGEMKVRRTAWLASVLVGIALISIPLAITSFDAVQRNTDKATVRNVATEWLEGSSYRIASINVDDARIELRIAGTGAEPSPEKLQNMLHDKGIVDVPLRLSRLDEVTLNTE